MNTKRFLWSWLAVFVGGCCWFAQEPVTPPAYRDFHAPGFNWQTVDRVLLMPLLNETEYTRAADEIGYALAAELQLLGRFEVVPGPCNAPAHLVVQPRCGGRFDELAYLELARKYRADVILVGTVTNYRPYAPLRMGVTLQAISPFEGSVVASVDGLWDINYKPLADLARRYFKGETHWFRSSTGSELAVESPQLFHRLVCHMVAEALTGGPGSVAGSDPHHEPENQKKPHEKAPSKDAAKDKAASKEPPREKPQSREPPPAEPPTAEPPK